VGRQSTPPLCSRRENASSNDSSQYLVWSQYSKRGASGEWITLTWWVQSLRFQSLYHIPYMIYTMLFLANCLLAPTGTRVRASPSPLGWAGLCERAIVFFWLGRGSELTPNSLSTIALPGRDGDHENILWLLFYLTSSWYYIAKKFATRR